MSGRIAAIDFFRRHPSAGLLGVQLVGVVLYPWMERSPSARMLLGVFGLVVLGAALRVVRATPFLTWLALIFAVPVILLTGIHMFAPDPRLVVLSAALEAAFYFYATGSLIAYMLQDQVATTDELYAAAATFTLLAWAFGYVYVVCQALIPGSFAGPVDAAVGRTWMELLYLSFIVLSGLGLADIVPVAPMARALVMLEAFAGLMYLALVVSRLIGLLTLGRRRGA